MRINSWMPEYDHSASYHTLVRASKEATFDVLLEIDFNRSWLLRLLMGARGISLAVKKELRLMDMTRMGFVLLEKVPPDEFVAGLIGQFWKLRGNIQQIEADLFKSYNSPGYAKVVWNFHLSSVPEGTLVSTETRIQCLGGDAKKFFSRYWWIVAPFSGLMRKEMLRLIRNHVERRAVGISAESAA